MLSERLYRLMLWIYPASHRREYGDLMVQLFRDRMKYHGRGMRFFSVWIETILDLVSSACREYRSEAATIADVLEDGRDYLEGLGYPRKAIALLATFLLLNSSALLSSEGGVLQSLFMMNGGLVGAVLLMRFCDRPKTQEFLRRVDRPLSIGAGLLSLLLLGGYVWVMIEQRLYENPIAYQLPLALLPIALAILLSLSKIRSRLFNGLWQPVFVCWGIIAASALGSVALFTPDPAPWFEIWGGLLVLSAGFALVAFAYIGIAAALWWGGVKAGGVSLRILAGGIRRIK